MLRTGTCQLLLSNVCLIFACLSRSVFVFCVSLLCLVIIIFCY